MKQIVIVLCCLMSLIANAQEKSNVKFSKASNWNELLDEAKQAKKNIFVDAFTTWCGPCKKMDQEVFVDKKIADFMNEHFVCIRIQMDSTRNDNPFLAGWRAQAEPWKKYITAYPCYLFFNPEGLYAGRELGYYEASAFYSILEKAANNDNNYLSKLQHFREGKLDKDQLLTLAFQALKNKDTVARTLANAYKQSFLNRLPVDSMLNPEFNKFLSEFYMDAFTVKDGIIKYMYRYPELSDSLFHRKKYSNIITDDLIARDYITSQSSYKNSIYPDNPDWRMFEKKITKDFDKETAQRIVLREKTARAFNHDDLNEFSRLEFDRIDKYGMDTTEMGIAYFNNMVYDVVFKNVTDTGVLRKAASFMKYVTEHEHNSNRKSSNHLDTYASLLYKAGEKNKALKIEQSALELAKKLGEDHKIEVFLQTINRMLKGDKIWL